MESQIWLMPAGSMALGVEGSEKEQWPVPALLSRRNLPPPPSAFTLVLGQSSSPPYISDAFQSPAPMLELRGRESSKSVHGRLRKRCQRVQQFLSSTALIPTGFYSLKLWRLLFLALEPWDGRRRMGLDPSLLRYCSQFLSATHGCGINPFHVSAPPTSHIVVSSLIL